MVRASVRPMANPENPENLHFLAGQMQALMGFCIALINAHPSAAYLSRHIDAAEQATLARAESTLVTEDFLDGLRDAFDRLKAAVAIARARQASQNTDRG